jgi:leader peptidase (prepilin peptidase)/N-methyltransferase
MEPLLVGALGLCFGSFFNVLIARLPKGESIVRPGSHCPKCGHVLAWYENIPVLAWIALGGKCRKCKAPISPRYIIVELLTGVVFLACYQRFGWTYELIPALVMVGFLVPLAFIDAEAWILPLELTVPGTIVGVALSIPNGWDAVKVSAIGAAAGFCLFRAVEYFGWLAFKKEAMGAGDKLLVALICAFLGARALLGLFLLSSLQGSLFGATALLFAGRAGPKAGNEEEARDEAPPTMTWEFLKPGLSFARRLLLIPYCVFWQPIPDDPKDTSGQEIEWKPGPTNLPFGPWLVLSGLELMLIGPWLGERVPVVGWIFQL